MPTAFFDQKLSKKSSVGDRVIKVSTLDLLLAQTLSGELLLSFLPSTIRYLPIENRSDKHSSQSWAPLRSTHYT